MFQTYYAYQGTTVAKPMVRSLKSAIRQAERLPMGYVKDVDQKCVVHVTHDAHRRVMGLRPTL